MQTDDEMLAARFPCGPGLAETSLSIIRRDMPSFKASGSETLSLVAEVREPARALYFLSSLTYPATRHVAFPINEQNVAFVNNSRNGSDYADYTYSFPRHLGCRFARIVNSKSRVWKRDKLRMVMSHEARIFDLHDQDGAIIRCVQCVADGGRWTFATSGTPHPIESTFPYDVKRKANRFAEEHLKLLASAYELTLPTAATFLNAGRYLLFSENVPWNRPTCTIEEADDPAYWMYLSGMGFVKHLSTHASSALQMFERCLEFNPEYESKVRDHINAALAQLKQSGDK